MNEVTVFLLCCVITCIMVGILLCLIARRIRNSKSTGQQLNRTDDSSRSTYTEDKGTSVDNSIASNRTRELTTDLQRRNEQTEDLLRKQSDLISSSKELLEKLRDSV